MACYIEWFLPDLAVCQVIPTPIFFFRHLLYEIWWGSIKSDKMQSCLYLLNLIVWLLLLCLQQTACSQISWVVFPFEGTCLCVKIECSQSQPEVASCLTPNTITAVRVLALLPYMSLTLSVCPWSGLGEWVLKHMRYTTCTGHGNLSFVCSIQPVYQETVWSHVWEIRSELPLLGYIWLCWV